jgi:hypothetical protein
LIEGVPHHLILGIGQGRKAVQDTLAVFRNVIVEYLLNIPGRGRSTCLSLELTAWFAATFY